MTETFSFKVTNPHSLWRYLKRTPQQVFSKEFCKNISVQFSVEHLQLVLSGNT